MARLERRARYVELRRVGSRITITRGDLDGSPPTTEVRRAAWSRAAADELAELIDELIGQGWVLRQPEVSSVGLVADPSPIEAELIAAPSRETWAVQGDWLAAQGDVRAELIALTLAGEQAEPDTAERLARVHDELLASSQRRWFAGIVELAEAGALRWRWSHGYLRELEIGTPIGKLDLDEHDPRDLARVLDDLLGHPSARLLERLGVGELHRGGGRELARVLGPLAAARLPALRRLELGRESRSPQPNFLRIGDLAPLADLRGLQSLRVHGALIGLPPLPGLEQLELELPQIQAAWVEDLGRGAWPNLRRLWLTSELRDPWARLANIDPSQVFEPLLASGRLRELGIQGSSALHALVNLDELRLDELRVRSLLERDAELLVDRHASLAGVGRLVILDPRLGSILDRLRERFGDRLHIVRGSFTEVVHVTHPAAS